MTRQVHVRLNDRVYENLIEYAAEVNKPINDCFLEALSLFFDEVAICGELNIYREHMPVLIWL